MQHAARSRFIGINWASVWNQGVGDIRFWMIPGVGTLAFLFFSSDMFISIGYLLNYSMLSDLHWAYKFGVGIVVGIGVSFMVHFGPHNVIGKLRGWGKRFFGMCAVVLCFSLSMYFAVSFFQGVWQQNLQAEAEMATAASGERDLAANERNTDAEQLGVSRAQTALDDARSRRIQADADMATLRACPVDGVCEEAKPIQRALGVEDDGRVRGSGACESCGETMAAMNAELSAARDAERIANVELDEALETFRSAEGQLVIAVERELRAAVLENEQTYLRSMRNWAEDSLGTTYDENPEEVQALAEDYAKWVGSFIAALVTILSFFFGLFRFMVKDPALDEDHFTVSMRDGQDTFDERGNLLPHHKDPSGEGAQIDAHGRRRVIDDEAPYNPRYESRSDARSRLRRAIARREAVENADTDDVLDIEEAMLHEQIADARERKNRKQTLAALRRELAELNKDDTASDGASASAESLSGDFEETITRRKSSSTGPIAPEPPAAPQSRADSEEIETLRRQAEDAGRRAQEATEAAERERQARERAEAENADLRRANQLDTRALVDEVEKAREESE